MSESVEFNGASSLSKHSIKQEFISEEGCLIKSEVKQEPDVIYYAELIKSEEQINVKEETKYESNDGSINTENNMVYEGIPNCYTSDCSGSSVKIKCWICETDSCEHVTNCTTVKDEPVDDATPELLEQFNPLEPMVIPLGGFSSPFQN